MNIPLYQSSTDTKGQLIDLNDALASIRSDARKDKILAIRNETDPIKRDALKRSLDMVCFSSLMSPARGLANVISPTFFSVIDFDHGPNGENYDFDDLKARLIKDPYAYAVFFSPKRGVKVLVRHDCDTIDNQVFHNFYSQLMQYFR